jgi:hypothetical protein
MVGDVVVIAPLGLGGTTAEVPVSRLRMSNHVACVMGALLLSHGAQAIPAVGPLEAAVLLQVPEHLDAAATTWINAEVTACRDRGHDDDTCRVRGLIAWSYRGDPQARRLAVGLFDDFGTVAGVLPEQDFDGAYRGTLHFVPRWPMGPHRLQLSMTATALRNLDAFFAELERRSKRAITFRWRPLRLRFFESVKRRTPSAIATKWMIAHNVKGSMFRDDDATLGTYAHELFHLNDEERGWWSKEALKGVFGRVVARCGTDTACLKPYAPDTTIVRGAGGTYYAFMPGNGVSEYAADVAKRWVIEHRALLAGRGPTLPWRCQTMENREAWTTVVEAFFSGVDLLPPCP